MADGEVRGGIPETYANAVEARRELGTYFRFHNTPSEVFHQARNAPGKESKMTEDAPEPVLVSSDGAAGLSLDSTSILS